MNEPRMPPAAIVARSGSLSNHSPARSATAIGTQRSMRYASALPSARNARPALSSSITSYPVGSSMDGGVVAATRRRTLLILAKLFRNRGYCSASRVENAPMLARARATSFHRISARPSFVGAQASAAGRITRSPCCSSASDRTSSGSIAAECASVGHLNPGAISSVRAQPPARSLRSRTVTFKPDRASSVAVTRPLMPAPTMRASFLSVIAGLQNCRIAEREGGKAAKVSSRLAEYAKRRVAPGRTHDAAAGMRCRSAHPQILNRRLVLRPPRHRARKEQLLERQLALEDVAFRQTELAFEIEWRHHLPMQNDVADVRCILGDRLDHRVAERLALVVPSPRRQLVRRVLHEARQNVFAWRRDGGIGQRWNDHVHIGTARKLAVLRLVVGALHVIDARRDRDRAAQVRTLARLAGKVRQRIQREVHLPRRSAVLVPANLLHEVGRQLARAVHQAQERQVGIDARQHHVRGQLVAVR